MPHYCIQSVEDADWIAGLDPKGIVSKTPIAALLKIQGSRGRLHLSPPKFIVLKRHRDTDYAGV